MNYKDLPDFCNQDVVFSSMIMAEIVAILLSIVQPVPLIDKITYLAMASMVIQWILIINLAILCKTSKYLTNLSTTTFYIVIFALLQLATILVSLGASAIINYLQLADWFGNNWQNSFILQNLLISIFVSLIIIRYAFLNQRWKNQVIQQTQSRLDALHARIRPHFLFNSLNSIAALVHIDANKADKAILNLSEIFRSSIKDEPLAILSDEIELVKKYLAIEQLRLDNRLQVNWQIELSDQSQKIPALMLQPLVENAIYHGIEKLDKGGEIKISLKTDKNSLTIKITNPVVSNNEEHDGNKIALKNISERLNLLYGKKASFEPLFDKQKAQFTASLKLPL